MHPHQSLILGFLYWADKYLFFFWAVGFAVFGAFHLVRSTGHAVHFLFKNMRRYSFFFLGIALYCFLMAGGFYLLTTPNVWNTVTVWFFKNILITVVLEVIILLLPINLYNTFVALGEKHHFEINR